MNYMEQMKHKEECEKIARAFTEALNFFGVDYKGIAQAMLSEHRTLQQNFTRLCKEWLIAIGETGWVDGRNEASHELGKKLTPILKDACLPFI